MAAGLGFKTFVTGEVLTAADTNGYLMQGVNVFASAAARTAAITSPQEGQMSFLKDTNSTEYYDGAAWTAVAAGSSGRTLISTATLSAATAISFTSIPSTYKHLQLILNDVFQSAGSVYWTMQFNSAGTYNWVTSRWKSAGAATTNANSASAIGSSDQNSPIPSTYTSTGNGVNNGVINIYNYASTTLQRNFDYLYSGYDGAYFNGIGNGAMTNTGTAINRVDFTRSGSQTVTGTIQLWGVS
jgi:hypothetical protein